MIVNNHSSAGGYGTSGSATVFVNGHDFIATNLTISNDYGEGSQAVALNLNADRAVFNNVRLLGDQDTVPGQRRRPGLRRELLRRGHRRLHLRRRHHVFNDSSIYEKRGHRRADHGGQHRRHQDLRLPVLPVHVTGAANNVTQLGRPWGPDAQVLYRESTLSATIRTASRGPDMSSNSWKNARFLEYQNTGAGAARQQQPAAAERRAGRQLHPAEVPRRHRRLEPGMMTTTLQKRWRLLLARASVAVPTAVVALSVLPSQAATTPVGRRRLHSWPWRRAASASTWPAPRPPTAPCCSSGAAPRRHRQQWKVVAAAGRYNLANVNSGKCVDVPVRSTASGLQLQQWGCGDGTKTNQQWTFTASRRRRHVPDHQRRQRPVHQRPGRLDRRQQPDHPGDLHRHHQHAVGVQPGRRRPHRPRRPGPGPTPPTASPPARTGGAGGTTVTVTT